MTLTDADLAFLAAHDIDAGPDPYDWALDARSGFTRRERRDFWLLGAVTTGLIALAVVVIGLVKRPALTGALILAGLVLAVVAVSVAHWVRRWRG